jgi:carboxyl-terminal processing protease
MAVLIVIFAGLWIDVSNAGNEEDNFYSDIMRFDNVATQIHQNYVEDMKFSDLIDNGVKGMMNTLDPHSNYMNEKDFGDLKIHMQGKFGGLGIQIAIRDKILTVMTPIAGTPASRAGIQSGDQIVKIDGKSTVGITVDDAVGKLRGEPGTKVTITIRRKGEDKDVDYSIVRGIIEIKAVPFFGVIDSSIGYISFSQFSEKATPEVERAIKELLKKNVKGMVLDMRWNPGGILTQAVEVAGCFLPRGTLIVSTRGRSVNIDQNREYTSEANPTLPMSIPLVVMVNQGSASASEIVAGAIQDWDRGVILGDTTFGKGSVQTPIPMGGKYTLKLTTAYYYTPSKRCINRPENAVRGNTKDEEDDDNADSSDSSDENDATSKKAKKKVDTTTYHTNDGRVVYGGGGIIPDAIVDQELPNMVISELLNKDVFFKFANSAYPRLKEKNKFSGNKFSIDGEITKMFYSYLDSIKFKYQSLAQFKFEEFKRNCNLIIDTTADSAKTKRLLKIENLKWVGQDFEKIKTASMIIDSLLTAKSKQVIADNDKEIKKFLYEALLVRHFGQDNDIYFRSKMNDDAQLKAAINYLNDKNAYAALLKPHQDKGHGNGGNGKVK